jgi:hypothetical protein
MFRTIRYPSPATVIALLALFIAMSGTAVAAGVVPVAKRALVADNAKKVEGKTVAQLLAHEQQPAKKSLESDRLDGMHAQDVAALPSPASTAAGMVTAKTGIWTVSPRDYRPFTVTCDAGQKAISGGWTDPVGWAAAYESYPTATYDGWTTWIYVSSGAPGTQSGTVYAICLK